MPFNLSQRIVMLSELFNQHTLYRTEHGTSTKCGSTSVATLPKAEGRGGCIHGDPYESVGVGASGFSQGLMAEQTWANSFTGHLALQDGYIYMTQF